MYNENVAQRAAVRASLPLPARLLHSLFERIATGNLELRFAGGQVCRIRRSATPAAQLHIRRPYALLARALLRGPVGFAESHIAGDWESPDLAALLRLLAQNQQAIARVARTAPGLWLDRLRHRARANSRRGSRRNIRAHYDLSNDFYRLWLDPTMTYSSALFRDPRTSSFHQLPAAQERKYRRMLELTGARTGDHLLEIGCGWGAFACAAASEDIRVTGITLSPAQLDYATSRIEQAGLQDRATLRLQDYRDVTGQYDGIVSIEMLEAVGENYWSVYFDTLRRSLRPGGRAALQVIVIDAAREARYRRQPDFIQMHIFPGGMLPTRARLQALARAAGLEWVEDQAVGSHYARTCALWDQRVEQVEDRIRDLGFDDAFLRRWHYYLNYCQVGFELGMIDVLQLAL
ncbi:MAG: cyclopropane-fatty-acyl-phospholipid synthase family protein, partial [Gammaproteobacteria bacterium]